MDISKFRKCIEGKVIYLATSDRKGKPNLIAVEGNKVVSNQILVTDNQMNKTRKNLKSNNKVSIVCGSGPCWCQLKGTATYHSKGRWLEYAKKLPANKGYVPKGAVLIKIKEGYDLSTGKKIK